MLPFLASDDQGIAEAARLIQCGECVAAPTETVYGLAADAFNEEAVQKIFRIKGRPLIDPLIVHLDDPQNAVQLVLLNHAQQGLFQRLADEFWPGPLTIVAPKQPAVLDLVTANQPSVAIRSPRHPVMRNLIAKSGRFLAAPSANPFGYVSPTTAQHVRDSLGDRCPHILDGGACENGVESTIIDIRNPSEPQLLRPGPVTSEQLSHALGIKITWPARPSPENASLAPGQLLRHYSPQKILKLFDIGAVPGSIPQKTALIYYSRPAGQPPIPSAYWLCESATAEEAARNLFKLIRAIDADPRIIEIWCELPPAGGLGDAIRDRLIRASKR